ncbi:MAG: iron-sulfur protein [Gracilibacter sp. BRH_c7a]|nr:MAG: iron-sulfur protein [Gracilibacter sp. BRH_c7a]
MKIVAINGSAKGKESNTNIMVSAFLRGAEEAGANCINIFLAEKDIKHCKGCHTCWTRGPGQCVTNDDMLSILSEMSGANIIVFATPVYFGNISGLLKVFMDRMTMIGSPHSQKELSQSNNQIKSAELQIPKLIMISNCGLPDRKEFDVVSLWINRVAEKMQMGLVGEIYATQGKYLTSPPEEFKPKINEYIILLQEAGKEIVTHLSLSDAINNDLNRGFASV